MAHLKRIIKRTLIITGVFIIFVSVFNEENKKHYPYNTHSDISFNEHKERRDTHVKEFAAHKGHDASIRKENVRVTRKEKAKNIVSDKKTKKIISDKNIKYEDTQSIKKSNKYQNNKKGQISKKSSRFSRKKNLIDVSKLKPVHPKQLVHFDLKGAPPRIPYFKQVMDYAKEFGADGFLFEYEDMFPWHGELSVIKSKYAYTVDELNILLDYAEHLHMAVIPLVQTFGHMEFVLKHKKFAHLKRNNGDERSVCPMNNQSVPFVKQMIDQILDFHPNIKWIHLGADEVFDLGTCRKCPESGIPKDELYEKHMIPILKYVQTKLNNNKEQINSIIWDDMVNGWKVEDLKKLSNLTTLMVWNYVGNLEGYFPRGMWSRYSQAFTHIWGASAFKGADRPWTNWVKPNARISNHLAWLRRITHSEHHGLHFDGIVLTAWSRFSHNRWLCELLPVGVPMMALSLVLGTSNKSLENINKDVSLKLGFETPMTLEAKDLSKYTPQKATFVGSEVYYLMAKLDKILYECIIIKEEKKEIHVTFETQAQKMEELSKCKKRLTNLQPDIEDILPNFFFPDLVSEFLLDKIDNSVVFINDLEKELEKIPKFEIDFTKNMKREKYEKYIRNMKL